MTRRSDVEAHDDIVRAVISLVDEHGYDGVQLRSVARTAHVSLQRIYRLFGSRDALLLAAVRRWLAEHTYASLEPPPTDSVYEGLMHIFRGVFGPWERSPRMLQAFHRARIGPGGDELVRQATEAIRPAMQAVLAGADASYVRDVDLLLVNLFYAAFGRVADGEIGVTEILPTLERAAFRLTADNTMATRQTVA
jgi:TetR/AcrR family transcriptional regulator, cholesterol catabolism regulator